MTGRTTDTSGYGTHSTGTATTGPHSSGLANKADPRVDSDRGKSKSLHRLAHELTLAGRWQPFRLRLIRDWPDR